MAIKYNEFGEVISVNGITTGHHLGTPTQDAIGTEEENSAYGTELGTVTRCENTVVDTQPSVGGENKLPSVVDDSVTTLTAKDLNGATKIKKSAFQDCKELTSVIIPDSVIALESYAFKSCTNLQTVQIGDGVETLGESCFENCTSLISANIPPKVTKLPNYYMNNCTKVTHIVIPENVTQIGVSAIRVGTIGSYATYILHPKTPPTVTTTNFNYIKKIIVPVGCGEAYKAATNWANYANYIEEATE